MNPAPATLVTLFDLFLKSLLPMSNFTSGHIIFVYEESQTHLSLKRIRHILVYEELDILVYEESDTS